MDEQLVGDMPLEQVQVLMVENGWMVRFISGNESHKHLLTSVEYEIRVYSNNSPVTRYKMTCTAYWRGGEEQLWFKFYGSLHELQKAQPFDLRKFAIVTEQVKTSKGRKTHGRI